MTIRSILKWGGIAGAISAIFILIGQLWSMADASGYRPIIKLEFDADNSNDNAAISELTTKVGLIGDNMILMEFNLLYNKLKVMGAGAMSFSEMQRLCQLANQLDYVIPECPT